MIDIRMTAQRWSQDEGDWEYCPILVCWDQEDGFSLEMDGEGWRFDIQEFLRAYSLAMTEGKMTK